MEIKNKISVYLLVQYTYNFILLYWEKSSVLSWENNASKKIEKSTRTPTLCLLFFCCFNICQHRFGNVLRMKKLETSTGWNASSAFKRHFSLRLNGMSASSLLVEVCASQSPYWNGIKPARLFHITLRKAVGRNSQLRPIRSWSSEHTTVNMSGETEVHRASSLPPHLNSNLSEPANNFIHFNESNYAKKKKYLQCWRIRHKLLHKEKKKFPKPVFQNWQCKEGSIGSVVWYIDNATNPPQQTNTSALWLRGSLLPAHGSKTLNTDHLESL